MHFRSTLNLGLILIGCVATELASGQEFRLADEKPLPIGDTDDELTRLLKSRRNELLAACQDLHSLHRAGRVPTSQLLETAVQFGTADVDARADVAQLFHGRKLALAAVREIETLVRARMQRDLEPAHVIHQTTALVLDAEIALLRAQQSELSAAQLAEQKQQLEKLRDQRDKAILDEVVARMALFRAGRMLLEGISAAMERQVALAAASAAEPAARQKSLESILERAKSVEKIIAEKVAAEAEPEFALQRVAYLRLEAEIALRRAKASDRDDPQLRQLLRARYDAVTGELEAIRALYLGGRRSPYVMIHAALRQARAGVELAESPAQRIKLLTDPYTLLAEVENTVREKVANGVEPSQVLHVATASRLAVEIELLRARREPQ